MKKIVALVLTLTTLFSTSACVAYKTPPVHQSESVTESETELPMENQSESTTVETTDSPKKDVETSNEFQSLVFSGEYADTLTIIRDMIDFTFQYNTLDTYMERASVELNFEGQGIPNWFDDVARAIFDNSLLAKNSENYREMSKAMYAYFVKDINNDGIDELFLFCNEPCPDRLIAVFTKSHVETVLLDAYGFHEIACFDSIGFLRVEFNHQPRFMIGCPGYSYPDSRAIYQILPSGDRLTLLDHVGEFYDGKIDYYRLINGERVSITDEEYRNFIYAYGNDNAFYDRLDIMRDAGLEYSYFYSFPTGK